jgi:hypothetical protein
MKHDFIFLTGLFKLNGKKKKNLKKIKKKKKKKKEIKI